MAGYIGANTSSVTNNQNAAERRKKFTFTANTTVLSGLNFAANKIHIFHNGIRLVKDTDFTEATDGKSVTLTNAAQAGDEVVAITFAQDPASSSYTDADVDAHLLTAGVTLDATNDRLGIGTTTPSVPFDVTKAGGGNFVANFQNTTNATPYGIHVKDAASGANGYPLFQVTNGAGSSTYFRVDSGTGIVTKPNQPVYHYVGGTSLSDNTVVVTKPATAIISSSDYSTSTGRFTAPVAGKYIFTVWGLFYPVDNSNTITVYSRKNGSTYGHNVQANPYYVSTGNQHHTISATSIVDLAANDYHEWAVNRGSNTGNAYVSQWNQSGYLLG